MPRVTLADSTSPTASKPISAHAVWEAVLSPWPFSIGSS